MPVSCARVDEILVVSKKEKNEKKTDTCARYSVQSIYEILRLLYPVVHRIIQMLYIPRKYLYVNTLRSTLYQVYGLRLPICMSTLYDEHYNSRGKVVVSYYLQQHYS